MRRALAAALSSLAIAIPVADAAAATVARKPAPKKKVVTVTKRIAGPEELAGRWGPLEVVVVLRKTTTILATKKRKIARRVTGVSVPVYPDHSYRSVFINSQALPILRREALQAQFAPGNIDFVSGATLTSEAFTQSLQAAILKARKA
jgi:hypothetical protein